jgi:hypothetical protein
MTVMFHDIHLNDATQMKRHRVTGTEFDEVLYADDTMCMSQSETAMNRLLAAIETDGAYYGLRVNRAKCEYLHFGQARKVKFADGTTLNPADAVKYFGCTLNNQGDIALEINKRIADCMIILDRLHVFFRHADAIFSFKLIVSSAVLHSKLLYGMETAALTDATLNRLDVFQLKGLRKILKIPTTYVDRRYTNQYIYQKANSILEREDKPPIKQLSTHNRERRIIRLAKLLVLKEEDPCAKVTLSFSDLRPHDYGTWRVGRPRKHWLTNTLKDMWQGASWEMNAIRNPGVFDHDSEQHIQLMYTHAHELNKKHLFATGG